MKERLRRETVHGDSLRILATHACQERCSFCHNEGASDYQHVPIDIAATVDFAQKARQEFGLEITHLTGGEPTLHPQITNLISALNHAGFEVRMTSNGDLHPELLDEIISSGVKSINFSLHAITPQDFRQTQSPAGLRKDEEYFEFLMRRKKNNIKKARQSVRAKLNTVAINHEITGKVLNFALQNKLPIRLMRNLNQIQRSNEILNDILSARGLYPIKEQLASGDSGGSGIIYGYPDSPGKSPDVKVKKFGEVYLSSICDECSYKHTDNCRERFYGLRLGVNPELKENEVRLCIDRENQDVVVSPQDIFQGEHYQALKQNYASREK